MKKAALFIKLKKTANLRHCFEKRWNTIFTIKRQQIDFNHFNTDAKFRLNILTNKAEVAGFLFIEILNLRSQN